MNKPALAERLKASFEDVSHETEITDPDELREQMANDMADAIDAFVVSVAIDAFVVSVPCGGVICWATTIIPEGWMLCDGRELSRTLYPDLFAIIGVQYGCGDGDTTFNIPKYQVQSIPIASNEVPGFTLATRCHIIRVKA